MSQMLDELTVTGKPIDIDDDDMNVMKIEWIWFTV